MLSFGRHVLSVVLVLVLSSAIATAEGNREVSSGAGTGSFNAVSGEIYGLGESPELGDLIFSSAIELNQIGELVFEFKNQGQGTPDEVFLETVYTDGSTISSRFRGIAVLEPVLKNGQPTGAFTAVWSSRFRVVEGTGRFRGIRGQGTLVATNVPFSFDDPVWNFNWEWTFNYRVKHTFGFQIPFSTEGDGIFDPANLGAGDPGQVPFPLIIGDGSGTATYDGTPTGTFSLFGIPLGPDQHFGVAQSVFIGWPSVNGTVWYPGVDGPNPDGSGREIHIMQTWLGQIWFEKTYFFELDDIAGTLIGRCDFRVVGGTFLFRHATGTVYCQVETKLADVQGLPNDPVAPFTYDFKGFIRLVGG